MSDVRWDASLQPPANTAQTPQDQAAALSMRCSASTIVRLTLYGRAHLAPSPRGFPWLGAEARHRRGVSPWLAARGLVPASWVASAQPTPLPTMALMGAAIWPERAEGEL